MNWEAIGAIGEAIGAAGVIISLLYLAVQIRGDARVKRGEIVHQQSAAFRDFLAIIATNHDTADIYIRGIRDFESLFDADLARFSSHLGYLFKVYEENYYQWTTGNLDPQVWHGLKSPVDDILAYPGVQSWWSTRAHWYSAQFGAYIAERLAIKREPSLYRER